MYLIPTCIYSDVSVEVIMILCRNVETKPKIIIFLSLSLPIVLHIFTMFNMWELGFLV